MLLTNPLDADADLKSGVDGRRYEEICILKFLASELHLEKDR